MEPHVICTTDPSENFKHFLQDPLDYLQSSSDDGYFDEDDFTIIAALQDINEDDVMRFSEYLCNFDLEYEVGNLNCIDAALPYYVVAIREWGGKITALDECNRVGDIIEYCMEQASYWGNCYWTLQDENGVLRMRTEKDECITFLMIDGEGETHNIGPIVQKVYGYKYED